MQWRKLRLEQRAATAHSALRHLPATQTRVHGCIVKLLSRFRMIKTGARIGIRGASVVSAEAGAGEEINASVGRNPIILAVGLNQLCWFGAI